MGIVFCDEGVEPVKGVDLLVDSCDDEVVDEAVVGGGFIWGALPRECVDEDEVLSFPDEEEDLSFAP